MTARKPYSDLDFGWSEARADLQALGNADPSDEQIASHIERAQREWLGAQRHAQLVEATRQGAAVAAAGVLSVSEAAEFLRVSERTIKRLIDRGSLRATRIGDLVRIRRADLDKLLR